MRRRKRSTGWRLVLTASLLTSLALSDCGRSCGESVGIDSLLASAQRWVRVLSSPEVPDADGTVEMSFEVVPVATGGEEGSPRAETIAVHPSFLPGIKECLESHEDVFLALASKGLEREMVSYVIVRGADGSHHVVGECLADGEELLRQRLDGSYDAAIGAVIGVTDRRQIQTLLSSR
jgi:hypothetical protein